MENQLSERQRIEEAYHDNKYKHDDMSNAAAGPERSYYKFFWELIGDVNNLKVLDFGCGNGWVSIRFANCYGSGEELYHGEEAPQNERLLITI